MAIEKQTPASTCPYCGAVTPFRRDLGRFGTWVCEPCGRSWPLTRGLVEAHHSLAHLSVDAELGVNGACGRG